MKTIIVNRDGMRNAVPMEGVAYVLDGYTIPHISPDAYPDAYIETWNFNRVQRSPWGHS